MVEKHEYARLAAKVASLEALVAALLAERLATARTIARHSNILDLAHKGVSEDGLDQFVEEGIPSIAELARNNLDRMDSQAIKLAGITPPSRRSY